jgi:hypothetical protein
MGEELSCKDDLFCGINVPEDLSVMTDLERKHVPVITAPDSGTETVAEGDAIEWNSLNSWLNATDLTSDANFSSKCLFVT